MYWGGEPEGQTTDLEGCLKDWKKVQGVWLEWKASWGSGAQPSVTPTLHSQSSSDSPGPVRSFSYKLLGGSGFWVVWVTSPWLHSCWRICYGFELRSTQGPGSQLLGYMTAICPKADQSKVWRISHGSLGLSCPHLRCCSWVSKEKSKEAESSDTLWGR